ncbi:SSU ribosomal protein S3p (S3e) [Candidatus Vidania fulgoroideae]|nr:SSU ribosomal protein S3p (S3e) [Candidatus Vidania fulgoroideae]
MGNKINPLLFHNSKKIWFSRWFSKTKAKEYLIKDFLIRRKINDIFGYDKISKIIIERTEKITLVKIHINIFLSNFIGKKKILELKKNLKYITSKKKEKILFIIKKNKDLLSPSSIFKNLMQKMKNRENYRIYIKNIIEFFKKEKCGIKIVISGRIRGIEIARKEVFKTGKIGNSDVLNKINYLSSFFNTKYGIIGIKILINKNEKKV